MKAYNSDYYTGLGDELATEFLGTREAHASLKEIQQEIDSRRSRIKQIKELISDKETELDELKNKDAELKQQLQSAKAAIELAKDDEAATKAALADYNKVIEEGKKTEEEIEKISDSLGKLKEELEELELEEAEYLKSESNKKPSKKGKKSSKAPKSRRRKKSDPDDEPLDNDAEPDEAADDAAEPDADLLNQKAVEAFADALLSDEDELEEEASEEARAEEESEETCESADFSVRGHVVPRTVVIKEERDIMVRTVNDLEFYNNIGRDALDFDRGKGMTGSLREWIKSAIADDEEISDVVVEQILPEILSADPDMIDLVKNILIAAEESAVPFIPVFVSRIDGTRFYDKSDAEGSIAQLTRAGVTTFEKVFEVKHQLAELEGVEDAPFVEESEVENFIKAFDGNKDQLRQRLFIKKPEKPGKKDPAKSNKDEA